MSYWLWRKWDKLIDQLCARFEAHVGFQDHRGRVLHPPQEPRTSAPSCPAPDHFPRCVP